MAMFGPNAGMEASDAWGTCRYGASPLLFRGPERVLEAETGLTLGGAAIWGVGWTRPLALRLEEATGRPVANLAVRGGGIDTFLDDPAIGAAVARSRLTILELPGAQNLSNAYYTVHPRRSDRFIAPRPALRALFEDVDFTEICFTRHLIATLMARSPQRFALVAAELRAVWMAQVSRLVERAEGRVVLLRIGAPPEEGALHRLGPDPMLVTAAMMADLRPKVRALVEVGPATRPGEEHEAGITAALLPFVR